MEIIAFAKLWWKAGVGVIVGALLCFPLAECHGESVADKRNKLAIEAANAKAKQKEAEAKAAADALDNVRKQTREQITKDLQNEANEAPDGHKLDAVLDRLRKDASH